MYIQIRTLPNKGIGLFIFFMHFRSLQDVLTLQANHNSGFLESELKFTSYEIEQICGETKSSDTIKNNKPYQSYLNFIVKLKNVNHRVNKVVGMRFTRCSVRICHLNIKFENCIFEQCSVKIFGRKSQVVVFDNSIFYFLANTQELRVKDYFSIIFNRSRMYLSNNKANSAAINLRNIKVITFKKSSIKQNLGNWLEIDKCIQLLLNHVLLASFKQSTNRKQNSRAAFVVNNIYILNINYSNFKDISASALLVKQSVIIALDTVTFRNIESSHNGVINFILNPLHRVRNFTVYMNRCVFLYCSSRAV